MLPHPPHAATIFKWLPINTRKTVPRALLISRLYYGHTLHRHQRPPPKAVVLIVRPGGQLRPGRPFHAAPGRKQQPADLNQSAINLWLLFLGGRIHGQKDLDVSMRTELVSRYTPAPPSSCLVTSCHWRQRKRHLKTADRLLVFFSVPASTQCLTCLLIACSSSRLASLH